ncbi:MAG: DUF1015 domain-containing protein [Deltaproteobacteria bacterium]|nr:DUF1015 domain-containing protein [Deltaproteobacteria bacterium]MBW2415118.1 DUF1015 domain-containing protein [Deltaproteobacteria bacterium]
MSDFRPFRGLRFAGDVQPRLAPPYDVIAPDERDRLAGEPENIVHLTLPPGPVGDRDYASAGQVLERWVAQGVLSRDATERFYVLRETTTDGRTRRGFLGALRLADYEERVVLPHERTLPAARRDRLLLTRAVRANLEPLFFLYEDRGGKLDAALDAACAGEALCRAVGPDGTGLELFALEDETFVDGVRAFLADLPVVIADGHHRYETMRTYRDECRESGASDGRDAGPEFVMGYLVNAFDPGSAVAAIHRVLRGELAPLGRVLTELAFESEVLPELDAPALLARIAALAPERHAYGMALPGGELRLVSRPRGDTLDVQVLHDELLPRLRGELSFDARPARLLETLRESRASLGIFLHPLDPDGLFRVVQDGILLPEKSTFFTPKVPSGLVLRSF